MTDRAADPALRTLDTRGLRCPLPVIRLETALRHAPVGTVFRVIADDPIARLDIPNAAQRLGYPWRALPQNPADGAREECVFEVTRGEDG